VLGARSDLGRVQGAGNVRVLFGGPWRGAGSR
jgi:hypothetical protein